MLEYTCNNLLEFQLEAPFLGDYNDLITSNFYDGVYTKLGSGLLYNLQSASRLIGRHPWQEFLSGNTLCSTTSQTRESLKVKPNWVPPYPVVLLIVEGFRPPHGGTHIAQVHLHTA